MPSKVTSPRLAGLHAIFLASMSRVVSLLTRALNGIFFNVADYPPGYFFSCFISDLGLALRLIASLSSSERFNPPSRDS